MSDALRTTARALAFVALASLGLGGCCRGSTENQGPSFRAPVSERATGAGGAPSFSPSASEAATTPPPGPTATLEPPSSADRTLGLARRLGKLRVDPDGPKFASATLLTSHYRKHGIGMGFASENDYLAAAQALIARKDAERFQRSSDQLFFRAPTGEFAVLSGRRAIRTYFVPNDPSGYWQRQKSGEAAREDDEPRGRRAR